MGKARKGGVAAVVLAVVAGAVLFGKDALIGLGGTLGIRPAEESKPAEGPPPLRIVVEVDQCRLGDGEPGPCPALCLAVTETLARDARVEVDATRGQHAAVEGLRVCLGERGVENLRIITR